MPTLSTLLFAFSLIALAYLSVFGFAFFWISLDSFICGRRKTKPLEKTDAPVSGAAVTVLIPSHFEGPAVVDAVETLLCQDYPGILEVIVLLEKSDDSSFLPLLARFETPWMEGSAAISHTLYAGLNRKVSVALCGVASKRDKLNLALKQVQTPFVAILDADHRAMPNWIASGLAHFNHPEIVAVQSRRRPLSVSKLTQLWDSMQNHIGNEILNAFLARHDRSVFFTGTTAVFRQADLKSIPDCITEDTFLSYSLLTDGKKIAYDGDSGSYEEMSPDLASYLARRRRWSCGHSQTFFAHLFRMLQAPIPRTHKVVLLLHGQFYFIPFCVILLLNAVAAFLFFQFTWNIQVLVLLLSSFTSVSFAIFALRKYRNFWMDSFVAFLIVFSQWTALGVFFYRVASKEIYFFLMSFPHARDFFVLHAFLLLMPIFVILAGLFRFRQGRPLQLISLILTVPFFMFLDLLSTALGFFDFLLKRNFWAKIKRDSSVELETLPASMRESLGHATAHRSNYARYLILPAALLLLILTNDLLTFDNCGEPVNWLWKPLIITPSSSVKLKVNLQRKFFDSDHLRLESSITVDQETQHPLRLMTQLDGAFAKEENTAGAVYVSHLESILPLGWKRHRLKIMLTGNGIACTRSIEFSDSIQEIRGRELYVNGEPFLMKGIIPSFSSSQINLTMDAGLAQIKAAGANVIRFYHSPSTESLGVAERLHLLVIDQPDESTWQNVDLSAESDRKGLALRFARLRKKTEGSPVSLLHNLGNELEIKGDRDEQVTHIRELLKEVKSPESLLGYSTYFTFIPYPSDVLGVNMLDSGETYWTKAVELIQLLKQPFYASELGGFVAHFEWADSWLRIARLGAQWKRLEEMGAMGGVVFQSHDNWAQPVASGYNDPFSPEMPDDVRGIWDEKNKPKPELLEVERIFSDLEGKTFLEGTRTFLELKNLRAYSLSKVRLRSAAFSEKEAGDFKPHEVKRMEFSGANFRSWVKVEARYETHHGFQGTSQFEVFPVGEVDEPTVLSSGFFRETKSLESMRGFFFGTGKVEVRVPKHWKQWSLNGVAQDKEYLTLSFPGVYQKVLNAQISTDGITWKNWEGFGAGDGKIWIRFQLPEVKFPSGMSPRRLVLEGTGALELEVSGLGASPQTITCQPYRECLVSLSPQDSGTVELTLRRQNTVYVNHQDHPAGGQVKVEFSLPKVFSPLRIEILQHSADAR